MMGKEEHQGIRGKTGFFYSTRRRGGILLKLGRKKEERGGIGKEERHRVCAERR